MGVNKGSNSHDSNCTSVQKLSKHSKQKMAVVNEADFGREMKVTLKPKMFASSRPSFTFLLLSPQAD